MQHKLKSIKFGHFGPILDLKSKNHGQTGKNENFSKKVFEPDFWTKITSKKRQTRLI